MTDKVLINEGAGEDGGRDLTVADPAAKSPAPRSQDPGRVEASPPAPANAPHARLTAAGVAENPKNEEEAEQLQQNTSESPGAAASTSEGSYDEFFINDVPDPTLELLLDRLLHPDKVSGMMEFGRHFF